MSDFLRKRYGWFCRLWQPNLLGNLEEGTCTHRKVHVVRRTLVNLRKFLKRLSLTAHCSCSGTGADNRFFTACIMWLKNHSFSALEDPIITDVSVMQASRTKTSNGLDKDVVLTCEVWRWWWWWWFTSTPALSYTQEHFTIKDADR